MTRVISQAPTVMENLSRSMRVKVKVKGRASAKEVNNTLLKNATEFMMAILFHEYDDLYSLVTVDIVVVANMQELYDTCGLCEWEDDNYRPTRFTVSLCSEMAYAPMLKSLGHELAHVKQWASGQKTQSLDGKSHRWNGQLIDVSRIDYYERPWEIDAHGHEYGLYHRFQMHLDGKDVDDKSDSIMKARQLLGPSFGNSSQR